LRWGRREAGRQKGGAGGGRGAPSASRRRGLVESRPWRRDAPLGSTALCWGSAPRSRETYLTTIKPGIATGISRAPGISVTSSAQGGDGPMTSGPKAW